MFACTIWQPWSSLIIAGAKQFEFREWDYRTRQPKLVGQRIVIHAGARPIKPAEVMDLLARIARDESALSKDKALPLLERLSRAHKCQGVLELSAGLGTAIIGEPRQVDRLFKKPDSDRLHHHMWAWPLTDIQPFPEPIRCKGAQGFWHWPYKMEKAA